MWNVSMVVQYIYELVFQRAKSDVGRKQVVNANSGMAVNDVSVYI